MKNCNHAGNSLRQQRNAHFPLLEQLQFLRIHVLLQLQRLRLWQPRWDVIENHHALVVVILAVAVVVKVHAEEIVPEGARIHAKADVAEHVQQIVQTHVVGLV